MDSASPRVDSARRGTEVDVLLTPEAVRRYSELDPERTVAALHLTC